MAAVTRDERTAATGGRVRRWQPWVRAGIGALILIALASVVGGEPFLRGLTAISPAAVVAAVALAAVATAAAAWRWRLLASRLGLPLGFAASVTAYYRSQFLNTVLPGGVVGDVHRAVAHGRSVDRVAQSARAVAAERAAGQAVQLVAAVVVLAAVGSWTYAPVLGVLVLAALAVAAVVAVSRRVRSAVGHELAILREAFGSVTTVVAVTAASLVVVSAHVATFVVACAAVGMDPTGERVTAAAVIAVLASAIPLNVGGWGPREGAAAWAFGAAGLGAAAGVAAATAYGVLAMIAVLPGAVVLGWSLRRRRRAHAAQEVPS